MLVSHIAHVSDAIPCHKFKKEKSEMRDAPILERVHRHTAPSAMLHELWMVRVVRIITSTFSACKNLNSTQFQSQSGFFLRLPHTFSLCTQSFFSFFLLLSGSHVEFWIHWISFGAIFCSLASRRLSKFSFFIDFLFNQQNCIDISLSSFAIRCAGNNQKVNTAVEINCVFA